MADDALHGRTTRFPLHLVVAAAHALVGLTSLTAAGLARAEIEETSLLGAGVRTRPAYDGSESKVREAIPLVRYFGGPWFLRTSQDMLEGGLRREVRPSLHVGVQLAYEQGREVSEARLLALHHIPDIGYGMSAGGFVEWDSKVGPTPITVLARFRQDTRLSHGAQADLRANAGVFRGGPVEAAVFAQTSWASSRSNAVLYGVGRDESLTTGLPSFHAGSGWQVASAGLMATVNLLRPWEFVGTAERHWLMTTVTHSPLVERDGAFYASLGVAYRF